MLLHRVTIDLDNNLQTSLLVRLSTSLFCPSTKTAKNGVPKPAVGTCSTWYALHPSKKINQL